MKDFYTALDCESPDDVAHSVAFLLAKYNFDQAFEGFLLQFLRKWYDTLNKPQRREFERWLDAHLKTTNAKPDFSASWLFDLLLLPLLRDLHQHYAPILEHFPAKELPFWKDVEPLETSCQRHASAFLNDYFVQRPMDHSWLVDFISFSLREPLPIFKKLSPRAIASQLRADSEDDIRMVSTLAFRRHSMEKEGELIFTFEHSVYEAMLEAYLPTFRKLPSTDQLRLVSMWADGFRLGLDLKPVHRIVVEQLKKADSIPDPLQREELLILLYCVDSQSAWMELPDAVRMQFFQKLHRLELPFEKYCTGVLLHIPKLENKDPTLNPCSWLQRSDAQLYLEPILDWLVAQPEESQVDGLAQLMSHSCSYTGETRVRLQELLNAFAHQLTKLPLDAAYKLVSGNIFCGQLDMDTLSEVYLGRMRQYAQAGEVDFEKYFSAAYRHVLSRDPMKALSRLLDALIVSAVPVCDEDLSFCADLGDYYLVPTGPTQYESDQPGLPAAWLMRKLYTWLFRYASIAMLREQGAPHGGAPAELNLATIRRFWAEYSWKKLDLKKASKRKSPENLTSEDYLEPRPTWRIAHLKSLADLGEDLGNKAHRRIHAISKSDPDPDVRDAAAEVYNKVLRERMKTAENPFYSFIKVTMWFRIANRESLGLDIDEKGATSNRNRELRLAKAVFERYTKEA